MRIGLDIDNVISDFDTLLWDEYVKEDKNKRNSGIVNPNGRWIKYCFDWSKEECDEFEAANMEEFAERFAVREGAKEYMDKLMADGHELYLISGRYYPHYTKPYEITVQWLKEHDLPYTKLILSKSRDKTEECRQNNVDIMVDDNPKNVKFLLDNHVPCLLMETKWYTQVSTGLKGVKDWKELYETICALQKEKKHIILDTDISNEIDDHFALAYLLKSLDSSNMKLDAITIAPSKVTRFSRATDMADGVEKSYSQACTLLDLMGKEEYKKVLYKGCTHFLSNDLENSSAVNNIIDIVKKYTKATILCIGALTNVATAITLDPTIVPKMKVVWLGGQGLSCENNSTHGGTSAMGDSPEHNFKDVEAVRRVFDSGVELVVIPCKSVASNLSVSRWELEHYLLGKSDLGNYLCKIYNDIQDFYQPLPEEKIGLTNVLWDISAVAYEVNADWFDTKWVDAPSIDDNWAYVKGNNTHKILFATYLNRNEIIKDFFIKLGE